MLKRICFLMFIAVTVAWAAESSISISHGHADGIYEIGEEISWTVSVEGVDAAAAAKAYYKIERHGKEQLKRETFDLSAGPQRVMCSLDGPGSVLLSVFIPIEGQRHPMRDRCGALVDPDNIKPSMPKPDDFDAFWNEKLAEQDAVPMNAQLTAEEPLRDTVDSWLISMDTIRGQHIRGRLARPKKDGKFPALLIVQWAGVYGLDPNWALSQANRGWLTLNILAHDQPVDRDKAFYDHLKKGVLKGYTKIGNEDREQSYFLRMNLACSRAVDYLAQHPDWDGTHIVVTGASQGGYQAIVAAGLNDKVTAIMAHIPAGCDHSAAEVGRAIGWPYWMAGDEKNQKKLQTARYFDAVNFAYAIKCPALIGYGMGDTTSRVEGVHSAVSVMQGPIVTDIFPDGEHAGHYPRYSKLVEEWKQSLLLGKTLFED